MIYIKEQDAGTLVVYLQTALSAAGFDPGTVDGCFGKKTTEAVKTFQATHHLEPDGLPARETLKFLKLNFDAFRPNGTDRAIDWILPASGVGFATYNRESGGRDQFGTKKMIADLMRLGKVWDREYYPPFQVGDISRRHGGQFPPHATHQTGNAADFRPFRKDGAMLPTDCLSIEYDRDMTRNFLLNIKQMFPKSQVLFNDEVLIRENLCRYVNGHSNHLHITF